MGTKAKKLSKAIELNKVVKKIHSYLDNFNEEKFRKAFVFAEKAHENQVRKDNKTPYIFHPLAAANILTNLHADEDTLIAALLHDVPEDTEKTIHDVEEHFGKKVSYLVDGITKLSKVYYRHDMEERQIESLKKLLIHSAKDPRVILIKLADRLHNMSTLEFVRPEKRVRIAKETLEIYVPIANLLGIDEMKSKLEDLCFKYLFPQEYESINNKIHQLNIKQEDMIHQTVSTLTKELKNEHIKNFEIYGREKSPYSIFKKSLRKNKSPEELEDLLALRIIVNDIKECYQVLGIIHALYKPKPHRFKDYIAVPKPNGYQSLHTVVFGTKGQITEFQIRTHDMHIEALYGIAAHYYYKSKNARGHTLKDRQSQWANKILEYQKENIHHKEFLEALKIDIFQDRIFTFTPKGDSIDLPVGATVIDFAYTIHTEIGNNAIKALINNKVMPLTTTLQTGDVIDVITSEKPKGPNREWLIFAKTNLARNKIRDALKQISRKKKLIIGRQLLQKEYDRAGLGLFERIPKKKIKELMARFGGKINEKSTEEVLISIGDGSISPLDVVMVLHPEKMNKRNWIISAIKKILRIRSSDKKRFNLKVQVVDRIGAAKDVLNVLVSHNINIIKMKLTPSPFKEMFTMKMLIEATSYEKLSYVCNKMDYLDDIIDVQTQFHSKKIAFYILAFCTLAIWIVHPFALYTLTNYTDVVLLNDVIVYLGFAMLFFLVFQLKKITQRSFPELREMSSRLLLLTFLIGNFALITVIAEIYFYELNLHWIIVFILVLLMYAYLFSEYISYKNQSAEN